MIYFGFTIGPVTKTISQARKTRELWASSFIFSSFMKNLLLEFKHYGEVVFAPDITDLNKEEKFHGAGIWPDRCFLEISDAQKALTLQQKLPTHVEDALGKIDSQILGGAQLPHLKEYFHCYACCFDTANDQFKPASKEEERLKNVHLFRLNKMLDDLEYAHRFQARKEYNLLSKLDDNIIKLYDEGFDKKDTALRDYTNEYKMPDKRVYSIPEIATREFSDEPFYEDAVTKPIETGIAEFRKKKQKETDTYESLLYEDAVFKNLRSELKKLKREEDLSSRHRYVAIVHADGDNIGKTIAAQQNDSVKIREFSAELMSFSQSAVKTISAFGAMPVYAGGDDLLFIAPLQNLDPDDPKKRKTIYEVLKDLHDDFSKREIFAHTGATLSFGLSITYYKYPLSEAIENSRYLLEKYAKKFCIVKDDKEKDALAVRFLTHSGHQFETVLWQKGGSFGQWLELFKPSERLEEAFIAGLMHKIDLLAILLWDACKRGTIDAFFKKHFNEAAHSEKGEFVEKVKQLAFAIYTDYQLDTSADDHSNEDPYHEKRWLGNILHAMLRLVQFQNAPDHD